VLDLLNTWEKVTTTTYVRAIAAAGFSLRRALV